jgi:hypothetical protein
MGPPTGAHSCLMVARRSWVERRSRREPWSPPMTDPALARTQSHALGAPAQSPADDRSMRVLELVTAGLALIGAILLAIAR